MLRWTWLALRYDQRTFWRTSGPFFAVAMPVMMLLIFGSLNSGEGGMDKLGGTSYTRYLAVGMVAFTIAATAYGGMVARVTYRRETGIYQRLRTTPMPSAALLAGTVGSAIAVLTLGVIAVLAAGTTMFDATLPTQWPLFAVSVLLGASACCAAGVVVSSFMRTPETVDTIMFATMMPVLFISGVFDPIDPTSVLGRIGALFPPHHVLMITADASDVPTTGGGSWSHIAVLAGWTLTAGLIAARRFRWAPTRH